MIIDWTYGAIAQLQGYFTTTMSINNSSVAPVVTGIIGCLTMAIDSIAPKATFDDSSPEATFDSSQPKATFTGRCDT